MKKTKKKITKKPARRNHAWVMLANGVKCSNCKVHAIWARGSKPTRWKMPGKGTVELPRGAGTPPCKAPR